LNGDFGRANREIGVPGDVLEGIMRTKPEPISGMARCGTLFYWQRNLRTINFDRHLIDSWTELFGIEIVYVLAATDTEGRTAIGGTHVIAFVEWRLWARQSGDWRSRGRA
jgi:hypothetical protein